MTLDEFLIERLDERLFAPRYASLWVECTLDAMDLLGDELDASLERFSKALRDYYRQGSPEVLAATIDRIPQEILELRGPTYWSDISQRGLKYRCILALSAEREEGLADPYLWKYGIVTAFQLINSGINNDPALIDHIEKFLNNLAS